MRIQGSGHTGIFIVPIRLKRLNITFILLQRERKVALLRNILVIAAQEGLGHYKINSTIWRRSTAFMLFDRL